MNPLITYNSVSNMSDSKGVSILSSNNTEPIPIKHRKFLGVELNEGIAPWNLIGAWVWSFYMMMTLEINATFLIFLLQDPDYFNMTASEAGEKFGDMLFYTHLIITIFCDIPVGFAVEFFGRKITIFWGMVIASISCFFLQFSNEFYLLYLVRFFISLSIVPAIVSPLITDYCHYHKRGLAYGYAMISGIAGLATVTKVLPFKKSK